METEEYKTHEEHEQITTIHAANKTKFAETYNVDSSEYDRCYDVFGTLHNPQRLKEIQQQAEFNRQYEEKSRRYQEQYYSNYNEENKEIYNQFYKALAKKFHPDANPDKDTTAEMTLLNQLKTEWGL